MVELFAIEILMTVIFSTGPSASIELWIHVAASAVFASIAYDVSPVPPMSGCRVLVETIIRQFQFAGLTENVLTVFANITSLGTRLPEHGDWLVFATSSAVF